MRRTPRKLSLKQCYEILDLEKDADLEALKHAYRRRAFELHPDLNPGRSDANRKFQLLNEAYVALSAILGAKETKKGTEKTAQSSEAKQTESKKHTQTEQSSGQKAYAEEDVLRDLLNDPFARRVFEDIYSELNKQQAEKKHTTPPPPPPDDPVIKNNIKANNSPPPPPPPQKEKEPEQRGEKKIQRITVMPEPTNQNDKGMGGAVKNWLRRQIDEEQKIFIPTTNLRPGNRLRLQIRQGLGGEVKTVEVTIPPDFVPGKAIRLRGLGKKVGPWQGDLYLILNTHQT